MVLLLYNLDTLNRRSHFWLLFLNYRTNCRHISCIVPFRQRPRAPSNKEWDTLATFGQIFSLVACLCPCLSTRDPLIRATIHVYDTKPQHGVWPPLFTRCLHADYVLLLERNAMQLTSKILVFYLATISNDSILRVLQQWNLIFVHIKHDFQFWFVCTVYDNSSTLCLFFFRPHNIT